MMKIEGNIENVIFRNEDNNFTILSVHSKDEYLTLLGEMVSAPIGHKIIADVEKVNNIQFGTQYKILNYELQLPNDEDVIVSYLSSNEFKGVGHQLAKKLVDTFGNDVFDVILNSPEKLFLIKGITKKRIDTLIDGISSRNKELSTVLLLKQYGFNSQQIKKIIETYDDVEYIIKNNPYDFAFKISGIGFLTCDKIALKNGLKKDSKERIYSAIIFLLNEFYKKGNVFTYYDELDMELKALLSDEFCYSLDDMLIDLQLQNHIKIVVVNDAKRIYLSFAYNIEKNLSLLLYKLKDNITIITGGPGTGKTYNINKILNENKQEDKRIILCAPTGRAAKRMMEVTSFEAKTIHRTLQFGKKFDEKGKAYFGFLKNEDDRLECDLLIVDEMSMVDESLMFSLMKAVDDTTKIVLVGDVDQLPSVGSGKVLKDMIDSDLFTVIKLTKVYRQSSESSIVKNAHLVNQGEMIDLNAKSNDFFFIRRYDDYKIINDICVLISNRIPKFFNIGYDQIQVLTTTKKGSLSVDVLNEKLQNIINKASFDKPEIKRGQKIFRLNDKVMQIYNRYDIPFSVYDDNGMLIDEGYGVFNGDIGSIVNVDVVNNTIKVLFDDKVVEYDNDSLKDLALAYAITVHKSQGSEYDVVVMPIVNTSRFLLNRKILYTAMTRAKKALVFVGVDDIFRTMVNNKYEEKRNSALCDKFYIS